VLLSHFAARTSEESRTVNGVAHSTFQEAARTHGLILDRNNEARTAFRLAYEMCRPPRELRFLLALGVLSGADLNALLPEFEQVLGDEGDGPVQIREKMTNVSVGPGTISRHSKTSQTNRRQLQWISYMIQTVPLLIRRSDICFCKTVLAPGKHTK
jgi:hypothetical protein